MLKVFSCIADHHDVRFVILAAAICLLSTLTAFALARQAQDLTSGPRLRRVVLTGYVTGIGVWATHFVAMLAYQPNMPTTYSPVATTVSVIVAITLAVAGWWIGLSKCKNASLLASSTITAGIAAMHAVGMSAIRTTGRIQYDHALIAGSLLTGGLLVFLAVTWRHDKLPRVPLVQAMLLTLGICAIHFGSMAAATILPDASIAVPVEWASRQIIGMGVASAVLVLLSIAVFVIILDVRIKKTAAEVARAMSHDALTGLLNISGFDSAAVATLAEYPDRRYIFLRIDLDRFGEINETYGRAIGDRALAEVGNRIRECCGDALAGRFMSDDFNILIADTGSGALDVLASNIGKHLAEPFTVGNDHIHLGAHVAASRYPEHAVHLEGLRRTAGFALYRAKRTPGLTFLSYDPAMEQQSAKRHGWEAALGKALDNQQFSLAYQPIACVATGGVVGFEALLRWRHPEKGNVPPAEFVPVAETAGLMIDIGNWALIEACCQAAQWTQPLKIAVNLSVAQFSDPGLVDKVRSALAVSKLQPSRLELEITESMLIEDTGSTVQILREIKAMGVRIAMDDFGTGFSSLSYFRQFPFDKVKIDQSFVKDMVSNRQSMAIVTAVIGLSRVLGMVVLAEGVETAEQLDVLSAEGCHQVQGYLIGRPATVDDLKALTGQINAPSHHCGTRCNECLERLRPPSALTQAEPRELYITKSDRADIAA